MRKEEILSLGGKELLGRLEQSFKEGNITRAQANKVYKFWLDNQGGELLQEALRVFS